MHRIVCYLRDGRMLYALETTDPYLAKDHYTGADSNPEIVEVVWKTDYHDGKGMQEIMRRFTKHH